MAACYDNPVNVIAAHHVLLRCPRFHEYHSEVLSAAKTSSRLTVTYRCVGRAAALDVTA